MRRPGCTSRAISVPPGRIGTRYGGGRIAVAVDRHYAPGMGEPETEELRLDQIKREREAHARAREAGEDAEERTEERRAERAAYLREKLGERAESEERVERNP